MGRTPSLLAGYDRPQGSNGHQRRNHAPTGGLAAHNQYDRSPSVDEYVAKVIAAGGELVVPRMTIPGIGHQAYCKDPEGNLFGIHEMESGAQPDP